ncbi:tyrosine-type recombinase/integrase [Bifidobacterium sp. 81T8]|nr:site-specific integrase [Bifidobacterium simiiventris]MBW3078235.1 tyrosine-type recombinase/integrase [Bifidobacterium simiiventris]
MRYCVYYTKPDGTRTTKRGFKRKIDADLWESEHVKIAKAADAYVDPQAGHALVGDLYQDYIDMKRPLWKPSWLHSVETSWRVHVESQWGRRRVGDLTNKEIQIWVSRLAGRRSASTTLKAFHILDAICERAVLDRLIARNPCEGVELPVKPRRKQRRVYLTARQLVAFADECANAERIGDERRALVLLLGFCGLRWGEAAALRVRDIDMKRNLLHVVDNTVMVGGKPVDGTTKTDESRDVPMPRIVADAILPILARRREPADRVFVDTSGAPLRPQSASAKTANRTWWPSALKRLGWKPEDWPSPHDLRHTAASIAVHAGANVKALQRMLGHSSATMTLDVYADLFDSDLMDVARLIDATVQVECSQNVVTAGGVVTGKALEPCDSKEK